MSVRGLIWKEGDRWFGALVSDEGVVWLDWSASRDALKRKVAPYIGVQAGAAVRRNLERLRREMHEYLAGKRKRFTVPVVPQGTDFERRVWAALRSIPYGKSMSYGDLAAQIGKPRAARAVGQAAGKNPIPIIIPCHRLLASHGKIGGFTGGLEEKKKLLIHEGIVWVE